MRLHPAAAGRGVHRLGRRRFLTELGRGTFAVAVLGAAACSGGDDAAPTDPAEVPDQPAASPTTRPAGATSTTSTRTTTTPESFTTLAAPDTGRQSEIRPLQWSQVSLGFVSAYVLVRGNEAAVVDTGTSGSADRIGQTLLTFGLTFDDVAHVVLTHHHPDHVGSLPDVMARAERAIAYAGELDIPSIGGADLIAVADGDDVFGLQVIETPGHTPGSIAVLDAGIGLLVAGDALNGDDAGTTVSGPNAQFTADMATAEQSVAKLAGFVFDSAAFGHGQPVVGGADAQVRALAG